MGTESKKTKPRYLASIKSKIVHDLNNQKKKCQVGKINPNNAIYFLTLDAAIAEQYHLCSSCLFNYIENYHSTFTYIISKNY